MFSKRKLTDIKPQKSKFSLVIFVQYINKIK